ncbi:TPA: integrase arm-type DNA-binding domain-containing protein [Stenotrophomonas maltophilia]|nr:integrase arm-type DNA-binding domain-containing protein [Stenotrophomonas maltophilia]
MKSLTDTKIRSSKPKASGAFKLTDGEGLYLYISRSGGRSWRYDYRLLGKRRTHTYGTYPELSLADARQLHGLARALIAKGKDPGEERRADATRRVAESRNTFEAVARDFVDKKLNRGAVEQRWTARYGAKVSRMLERDVFPFVGSKRITEVGVAELSPVLERVAERTTFKMPHQSKARQRERGAAITAIHIRQICKAVFAHAAGRGLARFDFDPTWGLKSVVPKPPVRHGRHLELYELSELWTKLEAAVATESVKVATELLALTFVRTAELRYAEKREFVLDGPEPYWSIPPEKMKKRRSHLVPLTPRSVELVRRLFCLSGTSPYLLPNRRGDGVINANTINQLLYRMGYAGRLSAHGFRGTASTALNESGFPPHVIEMQLAHYSKQDKTAASYNHAQYWRERVEMMRSWEKMVYSNVENVLPFSRVA